MREAYLRAHDACPLKIGDEVIFVRGFQTGEFGNTIGPGTSLRSVGRTFDIHAKYKDSYGITDAITGEHWFVPFFALHATGNVIKKVLVNGRRVKFLTNGAVIINGSRINLETIKAALDDCKTYRAGGFKDKPTQVAGYETYYYGNGDIQVGCNYVHFNKVVEIVKTAESYAEAAAA